MMSLVPEICRQEPNPHDLQLPGIPLGPLAAGSQSWLFKGLYQIPLRGAVGGKETTNIRAALLN